MKHGWLMAAALGASCGGSGGSGDGAGGDPFGLTQRDIVTTLTFPTSGPQPGAYSAVDAFPGLAFSSPTVLTHAGDGTDRLFVAERAGRIFVFDNDPATTSAGIFLDIRSQVMGGAERGLLGLAFDPDHASNGAFYVYYSAASTAGANHRSVISRFQVSAGDPDIANPASETILLTIEQPYGNHNGGCLAFGPDGMLYVSTGDGGSSSDPAGNGQNLTNLLGKVLRLAPDGSIPTDNPFFGQGGGVREEIWAYGLRNPWRMSFDRNNGDLWLGDVGQGRVEEIDIIVSGGNYGWDVFEGTTDHEPGSLVLSDTELPVHEYGRTLGRAVTGGVVYRGTANPSLVGAYVYADYETGRVWALVWDGSVVVSNVQISSLPSPVAFGEDEAGELYLCSLGGGIFRFEETGGGGSGPFPQRLSETGLFGDTAGLVPATGVIEYEVNTALWSDGARKRRWIALPGSDRIQFDAAEPWSFPLNTVLVKHFEIDTAPGATLRLETRVFIHEIQGWQGYTYRWNAQQDDADLLPGAETLTFDVEDPGAPGGMRSQTWRFPSRPDCLSCHTQAAGRVLGVRTSQLNRDFPYPAVTDNQLRSWNHIGLFTANIGDHAAYDALAAFGDTALPVGLRARAYLDVNCASCHLPSGPTPVDIDLRWSVRPAQMNALFVTPTAGDAGLIDPFIVAPGSKEDSVLWERMRVTDTNRMPPLGSSEVHEEAVDAVGQWIDDGAN